MKELLEQLPKIGIDHKVDYLIDTCFFIWIFEHQKDKEFSKFVKEHDCAITSFNAEELVNIEKKAKASADAKQRARKFLHNNKDIHLLEIPVHPGNKEEEHSFVRSTIGDINTGEHNLSDAVILAAAIKTGANILTRDKHDLFNVRMENFLSIYQVKVFNKLI